MLGRPTLKLEGQTIISHAKKEEGTKYKRKHDISELRPVLPHSWNTEVRRRDVKRNRDIAFHVKKLGLYRGLGKGEPLKDLKWSGMNLRKHD